MVKELLVNDSHLPELFPYAESPLESGFVRVESLFGAPKHGTELTDFSTRPFETDYYDESSHIFKKREKAASVIHNGLGNMWVGRITELGEGVKGFSVGQRVAGYGHLASTHAMRSGDLLPMPEEMPWQAAVCYDPMQFALAGLRDANLRIGDTVLISGLGAIGQMAAQGAKAAGASLVAVSDPIPLRREIALENGADLAFDPTEADIGLELRKVTRDIGVDVVIETSANYNAVEQCLRALGYRGNMALVGWYKEKSVTINFGREGHFNQQNIFFSRACSEPNRDCPRWDFARICRESWALMRSGKIRCENLLQPVVEFDDCDEAYAEYIIRHPEKSVKMGVRFPAAD